MPFSDLARSPDRREAVFRSFAIDSQHRIGRQATPPSFRLLCNVVSFPAQRLAPFVARLPAARFRHSCCRRRSRPLAKTPSAALTAPAPDGLQKLPEGGECCSRRRRRRRRCHCSWRGSFCRRHRLCHFSVVVVRGGMEGDATRRQKHELFASTIRVIAVFLLWERLPFFWKKQNAVAGGSDAEGDLPEWRLF